MKSNLVFHHSEVGRIEREILNKHKGLIVWFTGLSGAGKSTLAHAVEVRLHQLGCQVFVLDGDNVRHGLCQDLGFTDKDRIENIRRVGEVAKLFMEAGLIVLTAFISPFRADREHIRHMVGAEEFVEIYCDSSLHICESRDVKGLYKKARAGLIKDFTGITSPYEPPLAPNLTIKSGELSLEVCVNQVIEEIVRLSVIGIKQTSAIHDKKTETNIFF